MGRLSQIEPEYLLEFWWEQGKQMSFVLNCRFSPWCWRWLKTGPSTAGQTCFKRLLPSEFLLLIWVIAEYPVLRTRTEDYVNICVHLWLSSWEPVISCCWSAVGFFVTPAFRVLWCALRNDTPQGSGSLVMCLLTLPLTTEICSVSLVQHRLLYKW